MARNRRPVPLDRLERAAAKLRPIEREVLVLNARDRLPNGEIADRLGMSADAVERHLAAALCRLDRDIERQGRPWWRFW